MGRKLAEYKNFLCLNLPVSERSIGHCCDIVNLILESIRQIKEVSREKVFRNNIINRINKTSATITDNKSLTFELEQMIIKGLIDQTYKILIRESQQINIEPFQGKIIFTIVGSNTDQENEITNESLLFIVSQDTPVTKSKSTTTCENIENIESTDESLTFIDSQTTPVTKPTSDTSCDTRKSPTTLDVDKLQGSMMEIKSFFMNEINYLIQEISSLQLKLQQIKLNQSRKNNVCGKDKKIIAEDLKSKLDFYQRENQLLKDETMAKQQTIETILYQKK